MSTYRWARWGDVNAFFGLMLDNVAMLVLLVSMLATEMAGPIRFTPQFVLSYMIPGTALGVLLGDLVYTWLAFRLARRTGRSDVTAMPLGLDTPSTIAVGLLVLVPELKEQVAHHDQQTAMTYAWHVGALVLVMCGVFKSLLSPFGNLVRRYVPRAGLLGSLSAVALVLIAFFPLMKIAEMPAVGMVAMTVILISLVARRRLPGGIPGALAAVIVGTTLYWLLYLVGDATGWDLVPPLSKFTITSVQAPLPADIWTAAWWQGVVGSALEKLPIVLPFALATIVGGIDCTESAAAAGDEYDTRSILLTEGVASIVAGCAGGVVQTTPFIGHPAYKAMGGRAAYTLAVALFIGGVGYFGWFGYLFAVIPQAALYPILIFIGLEIASQSFHATPDRHYPALVLAALPVLAYLLLIHVNKTIGILEASPAQVAMLQDLPVLRCLANGFIVTSLLWGAILACLLDGRFRSAAVYLLVTAGCSLVGIIHSPLPAEKIALPWQVMAELPVNAAYVTPYHWFAAYTLAAIVVMAIGRSSTEVPSGEPAPDEGPEEELSI